jgi:aflatoxin B1 aldehyde reductase
VRDYFLDDLFDTAARIQDAAHEAGLAAHAVALRWVFYHSKLSRNEGDAVVVGADSVEQLRQNLDIIEEGPLLSNLVESWKACRLL